MRLGQKVDFWMDVHENGFLMVKKWTFGWNYKANTVFIRPKVQILSI
jgi:hypothetical protein